MRAVVLTESGVAFQNDYPEPIPAEGEVLVRVVCAGICATDLQLINGYMGFCGVLGHEFVGVAKTGAFKGQRVVGEINCSCHQCDLCRLGLATHCPNRTVVGILGRDGVFADYVAIPERNLHPVPDGVTIQEAAFTEPLAAAFEIPAQIPLERGMPTVVLGDGRLGNLSAQVLHQQGCCVTVIGKHPDKLALIEQCGIATMQLDQASLQRSAAVVVDCTGSATGLPTALQCVRPRGTIVMKTTIAADQTLSLAAFVIDEITLIGSRCGPFPDALEALAHHRIDVTPLITARRSLEQIDEALALAQSPRHLKVLLSD